MKNVLRLAVPVGIALLAALLVTCDVIDTDGDGTAQVAEELPPGARAAAQAMAGLVEIDEGAVVQVTGPVPPGTSLIECVASGGAPVELDLPSTPGTYYVFLIDETPFSLGGHPVRYAWLETGSQAFGYVDAAGRMFIDRPGTDSNPYVLEAREEIGSVYFVLLAGDGDPEPAEISGKAESAEGSLLGAPSDGECQKLALLFDGGDVRVTWGYLIPGYNVYAAVTYVAGEMAAEADAVGEWVGGKGFSVERVSQYWGNDHPLLRDRNHFRGVIRRKAAEFGPCPEGCCHELFIFIAAHGSPAGVLAFYPADGSEPPWGVSVQEDILDLLRENLPECVKVTLFLHACYAGSVLETSNANFCDNQCGLTILTTTTKDKPAMGNPVYDDCIDDFLEDGATKDHDSDGVKGDIYDRYVEMIYQLEKLPVTLSNAQGVPQAYHCPEGTSWCSLDGSAVRPPQTPAQLEVQPRTVSFQHTAGEDACPRTVGTITVSNEGEAALTFEVAENESLTAVLETGKYLGILYGGGETEIDLTYLQCELEQSEQIEEDLTFTARDMLTGVPIGSITVRIEGDILVPVDLIPGVPVMTGQPTLEPSVISGTGENVMATIPISPDAYRIQLWLMNPGGVAGAGMYGTNADSSTAISIESPWVYAESDMYLDVYVYAADLETHSHYTMDAMFSEVFYTIRQRTAAGDSVRALTNIPLTWLTITP